MPKNGKLEAYPTSVCANNSADFCGWGLNDARQHEDLRLQSHTCIRKLVNYVLRMKFPATDITTEHSRNASSPEAFPRRVGPQR